MALYPDSNCGAGPDLNNSFWAWSTYVIKDPAGLVTPFNLTYESSVSQIGSIGYPIPAENATTGGCPYIQFWFYDTSNQTIDFTYITPGQLQSPCISFHGNQVAAYSGFTLPTVPPAELLEWADEGSP
jgi:hypothetical protein